MSISHRSKEYQDYIASSAWQMRKERHFASAQWKCKCFICDSVKRLDVHHRNYERFGNEADNDLVTLCRRCHTKLHDDARNKKQRFANMHRERRSAANKSKGRVPKDVGELGMSIAQALQSARRAVRRTGYAGLAAKIEDAIEAFVGKPVDMDESFA